MNIDDFPPELFDLLLNNIHHPHIAFINHDHIVKKYNTNHDLHNNYSEYYITSIICDTDNRSLIMYYKQTPQKIITYMKNYKNIYVQFQTCPTNIK